VLVSNRYLWRLGRNARMERLMNTRFLTHVRKIFATYDAPPEVIRGYQKQWVKSVRQLGDKWLVAKQVQRIQ
jgi:hypothetical protein